jgi:hypothetical protein
MEPVKFVYLGEDFEFVKQIEESLNTYYKDLGIQIVKKSLKSKKDTRDFIHSKETLGYSLFIVDFSANYPLYIFTARCLGFENNYKKIPLMGLSGIENNDEQLMSGLIAGCKAIFVKGIEISAASNFAIWLYNPKFVRPVEWPTGEFAEDEAESFASFKLDYFTKDYLHVETNLELPIGEEIILKTQIADNIGASKFKVTKEHTRNLYYNLERNYDLEILAPSKRIEPNLGLIDPEKREPPGIVEGKALELFNEFKQKLEKWITANASSSAPKVTKVLFIDQGLTIFPQLEKNTDEYPFYVLAHRNFMPDMDSIRKYLPNFLVFVLDTEGEEIINTIELLPKIIQKIQEQGDYSPFLFIYNCNLSQSDLQRKYNYEKIITYQGAVDFKLFQKIIEKFESSIRNKNINIPNKENRFYISKERKDSFGYHPFKIRITGIRETTLTFKTTYKLEDFFPLKLEFPTKMWITILPKTKEELALEKRSQSYLKTYTAYIHGIGEMEKNQLRVYINKVFVPKEPPPKKPAAIKDKKKAA